MNDHRAASAAMTKTGKNAAGTALRVLDDAFGMTGSRLSHNQTAEKGRTDSSPTHLTG
jgi:hypothetical protein